LLVALLLSPSPARAGELIAGTFVHDIATPLTKSGQEHGIDLQIGWRGNRIEALRVIGAPSPHVYALVNTAGDTSFASAGISWRLGRKVYLRPGIGLAVHNGPDRDDATPDRIWFGSRILFAPELAAGIQLGDRVALEATWLHYSHAQLFSHQNPGIDDFGVRLSLGF
jgi:hypothetical protein